VTIRSNRLSVADPASRLAIIFSFVILSLVFGATGKSEAQELKAPPRGGRMQVLFIGNSLTYSNELPLIVQALAKAAGQDLYVESVAFGGFSLDDHLRDGTARRAIESRRWNVVVMQHGPSSLPESRVELRGSAKKIAPLIRKAGGRPAFFMVWPELERSAYFDAVRDSYSLAAADVRGMFIPAGEAWRAAWRRDPQAPLYSADDFHPSVAGSYTAALSIYGMLYQRAPQNLPARLTLSNGHVVEVPAALAKTLQDAATEANQTYGRPGRN
jgi:hypothetical protein